LKRPVVLIWCDPWFDVEGAARLVAERCELTTDRARFPTADAVIFPIPTLGDAGNAPPPRRAHPEQCWVAWCAECYVHYPELDDPAFMGGFDLRMTYRFDSDLPIPYLWPGMFDELPPIVPLPQRRTVPVAAFVSSAWDRCGRDGYLAELMRHVEVDSYGTVCHSADLDHDRGVSTKLETIATYRFTVAFENAIGDDYVTEKLFQPLLVGSVPIYRGAPNVASFAPGEGCYIDATAFPGPRELARFLTAIGDDDYARYHDWRQRPLLPEFTRRCERVAGHALERLARVVPVIQFGRRAGLRRLADGRTTRR
jgi:hypothetical protein